MSPEYEQCCLGVDVLQRIVQVRHDVRQLPQCRWCNMQSAQFAVVLRRTCCAMQVQVWRIRARSAEEPMSDGGGTLPMDELFWMSRSRGPHTDGRPHLSAVVLWSTSSPADTLFLALGDTWGGVEVLELRLSRSTTRVSAIS